MRNTLVSLFLIITVVKTGHGQRSQCGVESFQCKNGECIQSILLCDGRADCRDKSDETTTECTKPNILCPHTAFRCAYGACIDGDATCNGVRDCIDNSDETLSKCSNSLNITSECRKNEFKCNSGQCISASNVCDGVADCPDGSDETFIQCGGISCEQLFFQCRYGACIDGDLKCNKVVNCADGSDENPMLCSRISTTSTSTYRPPVTTSSTTVTCSAPPQPENGVWKLHRSQCSSREDCHVGQEFQFQSGAHLVYSCNNGFKVKGFPDVFCDQNGEWWNNIPVCEEVRCNDLNSASIEAKCKYPGPGFVTCDSPKPGTIATLKCRNSYRADSTLPSPTQVMCSDTGQWVPQPLRCVPGPPINIYINCAMNSLQLEIEQNNFFAIESLDDKIIIYKNKDELFRSYIDIRSLK